MKRIPFFHLGALGFFTVLLPGPTLAATLGSQFSYQGFLVRNAAPANGLFDLQFSLRDAPLGGTLVGSSLTLEDIFVTNGLFTVTLDFGEGVFSGQARWLDIAVRPGSETGAFLPLPPRDALLPTPHAHYARLAGTVDWSGLMNVPEGFADGIDHDTIYTAGSGLTLDLDDQEFAIVFGGVGLMNMAARSDHHHDGTYAPLDSTAFWKTEGNAGTLPGAHFLGTTDSQPLELRTANQPALRLLPGPVSPNVVGGFASNKVSTGVNGSSIGGGGSDETAGPMDGANRIDANFATIGGGNRNSVTAGGAGATVSGGNANTAESPGSIIAGGQGNRIFSGADYSMIPGGRSNEVSAPFGVAMGRGARANHEGAFVWADASNPNLVMSSKTNQMTLRASNGVRLTANAGPLKQVEVGERYRDNNVIAWAKVSANGTAITDLGVTAASRVETGIYEITIDAATADLDNLIPVATPLLDIDPADAASVRFLGVRQMTSTKFRVYINDGNFARVNTPFTFMVTGR